MPRPFKLTAPVPLERDTHVAVARMLDALLLPPAVWWCYPAGANVLTPQQAARYATLGLKRGLPDLWIMHGGVYCIELKRAGTGTLSKTQWVRSKRGPRLLVGQAEMFPRLIAAGVREIAICRTVDEVLQQLERWQIPLRPYHRVASQSMMSIPSSPSPSCSTPTTRRRRKAPSQSSATR